MWTIWVQQSRRVEKDEIWFLRHSKNVQCKQYNVSCLKSQIVVYNSKSNVPVQARYFQEIETPIFHDNWHMKVVKLSALHTDHLYPHRKYSWYSFLLEIELTPGHSAAERIMLMKNPNQPIMNWTSDLLACSAASYTTGTGSWSGVKRPGGDVDDPPTPI